MRIMLCFLLFTLINTMLMSQDSKSHTVLQYLVHQPKIKSGKPPLVLLLHGVGSNEQDLFSFANELPGNFLVVSVRAPYAMGPDSYAWYHIDFNSKEPVIDADQEEKSRKMIIQFIHEIKDELSFDEKQVYLCGFSQGAIMSLSVGLSQPELVKGIAVMSGRLLNEVKPLISKNKSLKQLKVFISHGTNDQVLDIQHARNCVAYLKTLQIHPDYKEYKEGHGINNEMLADFVRWLKT